jgi:exosortase K
MNRSTLNRVVQLVVVLGGALSLKFYYSTASVNQLHWILTPTTLLVEFVTGRSFAFESHAGYMSSDHTFLIAASCAGVNFLITAFLMLSIRKRGWMLLPVLAVVAYVATVVANAVRISIALYLQQTPLRLGSLDANQLHRLEGVFVYFGFLLLLFVLSDRTRFREDSKGGLPIKPSRFLRACFFPLLIYYGTTLGLPLVNGAYRQTVFWEHSLFLLLTPPAVIFLAVTPVYLKCRYQSVTDKRDWPQNLRWARSQNQL